MLVPAVSRNAAPLELGVRLIGLGVHGMGGLEPPAVQLNSTELLYPFNPVTVPFSVPGLPSSFNLTSTSVMEVEE